MPIAYQDIAAVAATLQAHPGEAAQRSAVSRYYYASLHGCIAWRNMTPGAPSGGGYAGGSHQVLLNQLRQLDPQCSAAQKTQGRVLAAKLTALKVRRVVADYQLGDVLTQSEVNQHQIEANSIIAACGIQP